MKTTYTTHKKESQSLYAAAIQEYITNQHFPSIRKKESSKSLEWSKDIHRKQERKQDKGYMMGDTDRVIETSNRPKGLAEKLGIIPTVTKLNGADWNEIKKQALKGSSQQVCMICQEPYQLQEQILLSCSHLFHRTCFESYEKFIPNPMCPLCRQCNYEKLSTFDGRKQYIQQCAIKIQKNWRMIRDRRKYLKLMETHVPKERILYQKYCLKKIESCHDQLTTSLESSQSQFDDFIHQLDLTIEKNKQIRIRR
ncbi:RING finger protein 32 [Globomyces sp. JEL0801]|nr:RING finger protein 32 [Globomyces sp. JEL0801]